MNKLVILWAVVLFLGLGCSKSDENRLHRNAMAPNPEYPPKLNYDPDGKRYIGAPELELRKDRNGFTTNWDRLPV